MKNFYLLSVLGLGLGLSARAIELKDVGEIQAYGQKSIDQAAAGVEKDLKAGRHEKVAYQGLEAFVGGAAQILRIQGHNEYAAQIENEWARRFKNRWNSFGTLDLGDHDPLSPWLVGVYDGLEKRLGVKIMKATNLYDIKIFNYGIPVVVHPRGNPKTKKKWGSEEYKLHFVPVAAASTYWVANAACSAVVPLPAGLGCGIAAYAPRYAMQRFIAPPVSDEVYRRFNK